MRAMIGAVLVLALAGACATAAGDDKVDAKKLIGKWDQKDPKNAIKVAVEFADKGKITVVVDDAGKITNIDGTYKLDGNKLEIAITYQGKEQKQTVTIKKLTDDELVTIDSKGTEETLKKKK